MWNPVIFFFLNGVGTLIIETAWLKKQLALFGSTPESYGSVLFVYFLGISAGSWYFGKRSGESVSRRTLYANFTTALLLSLILPLFLLEWVSLPVDLIYLHPIFYKTFIWMVAIVAIFPACFFLGGFFPLIAATVDRKNFVFLYGVQAFGTVFGIYLGSFFLPYSLGYFATFIIGIIINIVSLFFLNRILKGRAPGPGELPRRDSLSLRLGLSSFLSGFLSLLLQVFWIRLIALGTDNSIYAFGSASLIILAQLTTASYVTSRLPASWFRNGYVLSGILLLSFVGVIVSTEIYLWMTDSLAIQAIRNATGLLNALGFASSFIFAGYLFPSFIFPFLMRIAGPGEANERSVGIGPLIAMNGIGCAAGSIVTSFVLLPYVGLWFTLLTALIGYSLFVLLSGRSWVRFAAAIACCAFIFLYNPLKHPLVTPVNPYDAGSFGSLVWTKEGKYGIISVIDYRSGRTLWLNNTYQLEAGLRDVRGPYRMGLLPTVLHPSAKTLAMIGIGTGISSNAFLNSHLDQITLIELIPEVFEAAKTHFQAYNNNVFADPRVRAVIDDGRHYLKRGSHTFDIIASDVFTPWNEGTAYLYTVDHFKTAKRRLNAGGLFCLWLPAFQITQEEFLIIAKSFATVFPHTTIWQLSWGATANAAVALVGSDRIMTEPIIEHLSNPHVAPDLIQIHESGVFSHYLGPVVLSEPLWNSVPLNTLDRPIIEFKAARHDRVLLQGKELLSLYELFYRLPGNPGQRFFSYYDDQLDSYRVAGWHLNLSFYYEEIGDPWRAVLFSEKAASLPALIAYKQQLSRQAGVRR
jgi:spermidine synthase